MIRLRSLFFCFSVCTIASALAYVDQHPYQWAVIGAGPAGIVTIAALLENNIAPESIIWFDPEFEVGRIGKYYRNVPANSRAQEMSSLLKSSIAFSAYSSPSIALLHNSIHAHEFYLRTIADPLHDITRFFFKRGVMAVQDEVIALTKHNGFWKIESQTYTCFARKVILATGSQPKELDYTGPQLIPLDFAVDKGRLTDAVSLHDTVAVVGSGSSALLLLKHLTEMSVKKVINFYKHHHSKARQRSLIRGSTAQWIEDVLDRKPPENLLRVENTATNRSRYLPECTKIIYAVGFERNPLPQISVLFSAPTPNKTGILAENLYGLGFAFPEEITYTNASGVVCVPLIGITSFMNFARKVVPGWCG